MSAQFYVSSFSLLALTLQIENEYGAQSKLLGPLGYNYMTWAANMAVKLGTGVPWVMCKEEDAPDPVVSDSLCNQLVFWI